MNKEQKMKDYEKIYYEGLIWKKRFESDYFKKEDLPEEEPFLPQIFSNKINVPFNKETNIQNSFQFMIKNL